MNGFVNLAVFVIIAVSLALNELHFGCHGIERNHIECHPGNGLNLILAVPHGGNLMPETIPDRRFGCWDAESNSCDWVHNCGPPNPRRCRAITEKDWNTIRLAMEIRNNTCALFRGLCPAVVINLLSRKKFDANRNISEATFGDLESVEAFNAFHEFIQEEKEKIDPELGGLFVDIHGQSHPIQRAELGYLLKRPDLEGDLRVALAKSSIRNLAEKFHNDTEKLAALLRGNESLGYFMEEEGYAAVPSTTHPTPGEEPFFDGGYNTARHGSRDGGSVDAVQIESCRSVRNSEAISDYACGVALALKKFLCTHYYARQSDNDDIGRSCRVDSSKDDCSN